MDNLQTTGFDYSALDAETRIVVQQRATEIKAHLTRTAQEAIDIGKKLADVKSKLAYGQFERWYSAEFGFSRETANTFMRISDKFGGHLSSNLTTATSVLAILSRPSTPEAAFDEGVKLIQSGEKVTSKKATAIVQKHKPLPPLTYSKPIDDYQPDVPEVEIDDSHMPIVSTPPASPFKLLYRASSPDLMGNLHPVTVTPDEKSNVMAGAYASTKAVEPPVDSRKLQAEVDRLRAENAQLRAQVELNTPKILIHIVNAASVSQDDANVVMKVHGEATTRAALGLLIQYKVKPHDFAVFSDQLVKLVKDAGKDPLEEQRKADEKAAKKAAKRVYPANVNTWKLQHMMDYYAANGEALDALRHALGIDTDMIHWDDSSMNERREYVKLFQELERTHVSTDCYSKMIAYARSKWADIPVYKMADRISEWKQSLTPATASVIPGDDPRYHTITHPDIEGAEIPDYVAPQQVPA